MKNKIVSIIAVFACLLPFVVFGFYSVALYFNEKLFERELRTIKEVTNQQIYSVNKRLDRDKGSLETFAELLRDVPYEKKIIVDTLSRMVENSSFRDLGYVLPSGDLIANNGSEFNISYSNNFQRTLATGETAVGEPRPSQIDGEAVVAITTPIRHDGEMVAVLSGVYEPEALRDLFMSSFGGAGYNYITSDKGIIVAKSQNANITAEGELDGHIVSSGDLSNGWNIYSVVPVSAVEGTVKQVVAMSIAQAVVTVALFLVFIFAVVRLQKKHYGDMEKIAFRDEQTGLPNLAKFKIDASCALAKNPDTKYTIVKFGISDFGLISQILSFEASNKVVLGVAHGLRCCMMPGKDFVARYSSDEFICLFEIGSEEEGAAKRTVCEKSFEQFMGVEFTYKISFISGYYLLSEDGCRDISLAIERVNMAHSRAKTLKAYDCKYDDVLVKDAMFRREIENRMEKALAGEEFTVHLQPKYRLSDESIVGAEALVRWQDHGKEMVYPGSFIPLFEENGFIVQLDMYIFEKCCETVKKWVDSGISPVRISVNFSNKHLKNTQFVNELCAAADKHGVPHNLLEVEMLESSLFENEQALSDVYDALHKAGFSLSMDGFGTGYSSLGLLKNIPVDVIKIDKNFFVGSDDDNRRANLVVKCVIDMAKRLGIETVAEGVEIKEDIELLRKFGCDLAQGYYFTKAMPLSDFQNVLRRREGGQAV